MAHHASGFWFCYFLCEFFVSSQRRKTSVESAFPKEFTYVYVRIFWKKKLFSRALLKCSYFLRRPWKLTKSSLSIWRLLHSVKSMVKISSIFVAFLENMNFQFESYLELDFNNKGCSSGYYFLDQLHRYRYFTNTQFWRFLGYTLKIRILQSLIAKLIILDAFLTIFYWTG